MSVCQNLLFQDLEACPESYEQLFHCIDSNDDKTITYTELRNYLRLNSSNISANKNEIDLNREILEQIYQEADRNGEGKIDYNAFEGMMKNPQNKEKIMNIMRRFNTHLVKLVPAEKNYHDYQKCFPPPVGIVSISILQVILYFVAQKYGLNDLLRFDPDKKLQIWRYFTYIFIHMGYIHLCINLAVQIVLGISLEYVNRWWRIIIIYVTGAIYGSIWCGVFTVQPVVGASGAAFSLISAHIPVVILNWDEMAFPMGQLITFAVWIMIEIVRYITALQSAVKSDVAFVAHIAGIVGGFLMGMVILRNIKEHTFERVLRRVFTIVLIFTTLIGIVLNMKDTKW